MAKVKQVKKVVKLQIPAAKANPAPPVGPALGQAGVNIQQFCSQFNDKTASMAGYVIQLKFLFMKTVLSLLLQKLHQHLTY